jgi:hypothetical protein
VTAPTRPPITHVAILYQGKVYSLPPPNRHFHLIRHIARETGAEHVDGEEGFLDASGRFLRRKPAQESARQNGQIKGGKIIGGVLTSEDLW